MTNWHDWLLVAWPLGEFATRVAAVVRFPRNRRPQSAIAWLLLVLLVPIPGFVAFLVLGDARLSRRRRARQRTMDARIAAALPQDGTVDGCDPALAGIARLNRTLGGMPIADGNSATLLPDPADMMHALAADIDRAERFVHLEFYIVAEDDETAPVFAAVRRATARGVAVRMLLDHVASRGYPRFRRLRRRLTAAGVEWRLMQPFQPLRLRAGRPDLRNHRKLAVVDGRWAYAGSQNLIDRRYDVRKSRRAGHSWLDLMARFEGPVVAQLDAVFATDWFIETGESLTIAPSATAARQRPVRSPGAALLCQVVPSGPAFPYENGLRTFVAVLGAAHRRVGLVSPYFVPDETMLMAITMAVQRGVEVELFVSAVGDHPSTWHAQRSYYEALLRAGARIHAYRAPTILHAKHVTVDDDLAVIGSSNMDVRSFRLNHELSVLVRGRSFVDRVRAVEDGYRADSDEIHLDEWLRRPRRARALDDAARLTSSLQ